MKKSVLKALKYILIGVAVFVAILGIEICIIYAVKGNDTWSYLKDAFEWYINFIIKY